MPAVTVRYWAGARRAAGQSSEHLSAGSVRELLDQLRARPELQDIVPACSVLVDGLSSPPETELGAGAVVDLLPPFAGG
jgi:molybdopterin converting factor small subunit